jgi:hypothetical protein
MIDHNQNRKGKLSMCASFNICISTRMLFTGRELKSVRSFFVFSVFPFLVGLRLRFPLNNTSVVIYNS